MDSKAKRTVVFMAALGFAATISQVLLVRMLLMAFKGNELGVGVLFGMWLLASAVGAWLGERKRPSLSKLWIGITLMAILLPLELTVASMPRYIFKLLPGNALSLGQIVILAVITLCPTAFVSGMIYVLGCKALSVLRGGVAIGYLAEALGATLSGSLFSFLLAGRMMPMQVAAITLFLISVAAALTVPERRKYALMLMAVPIVLFLSAHRLERWALSKQWHGYEIEDLVESPYGRTVVTSREGEYHLFHNGGLFATWPFPDYEHIEPLVHIPLNVHPQPEDVLLIGGGTPLLHEILKYPISRVVYAEIDPKLVEVLTRYTDFPNDERLLIAIEDGRKFLRDTDMMFDVVILDLPPPMTLEINRFYTDDFFRLVRTHLRGNGILALTLPYSVSYAATEIVKMDGSVIRALRAVFDTTTAFANGELLVLSGDTLSSAEETIFRFELNGVQTSLVSGFYIAYKFENSVDLDEFTQKSGSHLNTDRRPISAYYGMTYWSLVFSPELRSFLNALLKIRFWHVIIAVMAIFAAVLLGWRSKGSVGFAIATTGFAGMAFDVIPILVFQMDFGYVYKTIGLIVAGFHAGLALGGSVSYAILRRRGAERAFKFLLINEMSLIAVTLLSFGLLSLGKFGILAVAVLGGLFVGMEFALAVEVSGGHIGRLYASDLFGGLVAALILTPIFVPILGLGTTLALIAFLKAVSLVGLKLTVRFSKA